MLWTEKRKKAVSGGSFDDEEQRVTVAFYRGNGGYVGREKCLFESTSTNS